MAGAIAVGRAPWRPDGWARPDVRAPGTALLETAPHGATCGFRSPEALARFGPLAPGGA